MSATPEELNAELAKAVNRLSAESGSNTPDFILGRFLGQALAALDEAIVARDSWHGLRPRPGGAPLPSKMRATIEGDVLDVLASYGGQTILAGPAMTEMVQRIADVVVSQCRRLFLVVAEDDSIGVRAWTFTSAGAAIDAAWEWARSRVKYPQTGVEQLEGTSSCLLRLSYGGEDNVVWVSQSVADAPLIVG